MREDAAVVGSARSGAHSSLRNAYVTLLFSFSSETVDPWVLIVTAVVSLIALCTP